MKVPSLLNSILCQHPEFTDMMHGRQALTVCGYIIFVRAWDHPNFKKNAPGVKRPFTELSESSGIVWEQLSELRN